MYIYRLLKILNAKGYERKITTDTLRAETGIKDVRTLRQQIENERSKGHIICATNFDGGGYFLPETLEEVRHELHKFENRQRIIKRQAKALARLTRWKSRKKTKPLLN